MVYTVVIHELHDRGRRRREWAQTMCLVLFGPFGKFFLSISVLLISIGTFYVLNGWSSLGKAATTKTGPNNARHVIWAISLLFID